jgi:outer membrane receptor protein involved in Fe transport
VASILEEFSESPFPGSSFIDFTGTTENSSFDWLSFTSINYSQGFWSIGLRWEHMPALNRAPSASADIFGVKSHDQFDMFSSWSFNDNYELRFGVDNFLNEDPAIVGASTADANRGTTNSDYDPFGRRYYVGLSVSF